MTAPAVEVSLPSGDELLVAGSPDPRAEAARLTESGDPGRIATVAENGRATDRCTS